MKLYLKNLFKNYWNNSSKWKKNEKLSNKKILDLEKINEDNYNQLTEEFYLHSKAINPSNINNKIISEFLTRKKKKKFWKK